MLVEITNTSEIKEVRNKDREIIALKQEVYAHLPGSHYPVKCYVRVKDRLRPGHYIVALAYKVGKFGDIEIDPFATPECRQATESDFDTEAA